MTASSNDNANPDHKKLPLQVMSKQTMYVPNHRQAAGIKSTEDPSVSIKKKKKDKHA